jgi:hypothetical protein
LGNVVKPVRVGAQALAVPQKGTELLDVFKPKTADDWNDTFAPHDECGQLLPRPESVRIDVRGCNEADAATGSSDADIDTGHKGLAESNLGVDHPNVEFSGLQFVT